MTKILHSHVDIEIQCPPEQVWSVVSDYATDTRWRKMACRVWRSRFWVGGSPTACGEISTGCGIWSKPMFRFLYTR